MIKTTARACPSAIGRRRRDEWRVHAASRDPKRKKETPTRARTPTPTQTPPPPLVAAAAGATLGPLLDGIHSSVGLQVYDLYPVDVLCALHTSALVPALLGAFYVVLQGLDAAAEALLQIEPGPPPAAASAPADDDEPSVAACYASLALGLALSASLHSLGTVPPAAIAACLAIFAAANWRLFDGTGRGLALAFLCAAVAPLAEAQLMARFGAWHYPRADVSVPVLFANLFVPAGAAPPPASVGFVSWVPLCYFFYAPSVLLLGRRLRAARREGWGADTSGARRRK